MVPDASSENRQTLAQSHLLCHCPCLLQTAVLLGSFLYGGRLGYDRPRTGQPDGNPPDVPGPPDHPGQVAEPGSGPSPVQETKGGRSTKRRRTEPSGHPAQGCRDDATHGQTPSAARDGNPRSAPGRHIRDVLQQAARRNSAGSDQGDTGLEECSGNEPPAKGTITATSLSSSPDGPPEQGHPDLQVPERGCAADHIAAERTADGGLQLAVPGMGPQGQAPEEERAEETHHHDEAHGTRGGIDRNGPQPQPDYEISGSGLRLGATSGAMEITDQHASRCSLGPADAADAQQHVGTTGNIAETSFPDEVEPGSLLAEHADPLQPQGQGAGQRQEGQQTASELIFSLEMVQTLMMHLVLANSTNWCFANCTFLCAVWALVCIDALDPGIRGDKFGLIQTFLKSHSRQKAALESENWFQALVQQWGQPLGQHDCSEFTNAFVSWLRAPAIDLRWESRVENAGQICVLDKGSFFMPITLQFPANHDGQGTKYLTTLFSDWRQVQGMTAALTQAPPLICVHLDRMYHDESGTLCKSACAIDLNSAVQVPHFCNSGVKHEMSTYILVAAAAHLGADGAGHYRALMKVRPSVDEALNPFQWILTQDNESPAPVWLPPEWMKKNLTTMWLVRDDCLLLPTHRDQFVLDSSAIQEDTTAAILTLLAKTHGIETNHSTA